MLDMEVKQAVIRGYPNTEHSQLEQLPDKSLPPMPIGAEKGLLGKILVPAYYCKI